MHWPGTTPPPSCNTLRVFCLISAVKKDRVMWWIIDIIADGDLTALGFVLAAMALLGVLVMRL
jgi:hypothetical protein